MKHAAFAILALSFCTHANSQKFSVITTDIFKPENKRIFIYQDNNKNRLILFKTGLHVNTDGSPVSYHPYDLRGNSKAINTILNAVAIYRTSDGVRISNPKNRKSYSSAQIKLMTSEAYKAFEDFRDSEFNHMPQGYNIIWKNVLVANKQGKPCILSQGKYRGYFASAIALKNGLKTDRGECDCNDQVNPLEIPSFVLPGGKNVLKHYGAQIGDLLLAYNPDNQKLVYGVIGDSGPSTHLGEGSVIMNMNLLNKKNLPNNRKETYQQLSIDKKMIICIIPNSKLFQKQLPYSTANVEERIIKWFNLQGFAEERDIQAFLIAAQSNM